MQCKGYVEVAMVQFTHIGHNALCVCVRVCSTALYVWYSVDQQDDATEEDGC